MRSLVRGNANAAPGCVRHVRNPGKPGFGVGSGLRRGGSKRAKEDEDEQEREHDDHERGHDHEAEQEHELGAPLARQLGMEQRFLEVRAGAGSVSCGLRIPKGEATVSDVSNTKSGLVH